MEHEPLGVALVISAWNYPVYTAIPQVAAAIAAGNCVILKPSELAAETSGVIKRLFDEHMDRRNGGAMQDISGWSRGGWKWRRQ